jgi:HK97 family phage prohead protease
MPEHPVIPIAVQRRLVLNLLGYRLRAGVWMHHDHIPISEEVVDQMDPEVWEAYVTAWRQQGAQEGGSRHEQWRSTLADDTAAARVHPMPRLWGAAARPGRGGPGATPDVPAQASGDYMRSSSMEYLISQHRLERQAVDVSKRTIRGLAVNWDSKVPDQYGGTTQFRKGAFAASLASVKDGFVKVTALHDDSIGLVTAGEETARGLEITGKISATAKGDEALTLATDGVWGAMSIGWEPRQWSYVTEEGQTLRVITEAFLWEVALCAWGRDPSAVLEEVFQRQLQAKSVTQHNALAIIAHMERLTAQYTSDRRPATLPEPTRPLMPDYAEWPSAMRPELITRRLEGIVCQERAASYYQHARQAHASAWAGWDHAMRQRGY